MILIPAHLLSHRLENTFDGLSVEDRHVYGRTDDKKEPVAGRQNNEFSTKMLSKEKQTKG